MVYTHEDEGLQRTETETLHECISGEDFQSADGTGIASVLGRSHPDSHAADGIADQSDSSH
jgi:hypothetical protein